MAKRSQAALAALLALGVLASTGFPGEGRAAGAESASEQVLEVWRLHDAGEVDRALQLAETIHGTEGDSRLPL